MKLLLPILLTLTHETRQPFLRLALPLLACLSVMHGVMPPHPGPVVAVESLKANMGLVLLWGFVIGIPTAAVARAIRIALLFTPRHARHANSRSANCSGVAGSPLARVQL